MKPKLILIKSRHIEPKLIVWRDEYLESKRINIEQTTIRNYENAINLYIKYVGEAHWPPTRFDVINFLDETEKQSSQITAFSYWGILRAWFNYMAKSGHFAHFPNPAKQIEQLGLAPRTPKKLPKGIPDEHVKKLFGFMQSLQDTTTGIRDLAMLHLLYRSGGRSGEIATLTKQMLYLNANRIFIPAERAKDNEDREMYFGEKVKMDICVWLALLSDSGYKGEWLFPSTRGKKITHDPITVSGVNQMFHRRLKAAGLPMYRVHDWRHTFTKAAVREKKPLSSIQKQLGHASPDMVMHYAKVFSLEQAQDFSDFGDDE